MKNRRFEKKATQYGVVWVLLCLLLQTAGAVRTVQAAPRQDLRASNGVADHLALSGCSKIYDGGNGWVIDKCTVDPDVPTPMTVLVNGVSKGKAVAVRIYHKSQKGPGLPQVAVLYASGFVRLKQNADPSPSNPFGTSFILGPAYWSGANYYHSPQLERLAIDASWLPNAPLRMRAVGTNQDFDVSYEMELPPPRDRQTRLHVMQAYEATTNITIDPARRAEYQGFKLVQASSMYINQGGTCAGGYTDCHDSDAARFIGDDLARRQVAFASLAKPAFVFDSPLPLGSTWLDVLHSDNKSWQSQTGANTNGNSPNARIALDALPADRTLTPQGRITATNNPNNDNLNLWLHDDGPASASWLSGENDQIGYWLLAQDNPPDPWADLGLRPGLTFLDFKDSSNCYFVKDPAQSTSGAVGEIDGYTGKAVQLDYSLGSTDYNWAQVRCDFSPALDLSAYDHLRFEWRGDPGTSNSIEVGLIDPSGHIFARGYHHMTQHTWWGQMVAPFEFLDPWTPGTTLDPSQVSAFFVSVVKDPVDDTGGSGTLAIDNLGAYNVRDRSVPGAFSAVTPNSKSTKLAASWIGSQQQPTGLVKSWTGDVDCLAHMYDQALALIVFSHRGMWANADALVNALAAVQNSDGSWYKTYDCGDLEPLTSELWEGDIAWVVYALGRYLSLGGASPLAGPALQNGAGWLAGRVDPVDGCLSGDHKEFTEATIDVWWALQAAGKSQAGNAGKIKTCLLTRFWDADMGRFKGGFDWWKPYLDNQTWGAAFLRANGKSLDARRALSYARDVLRLPAQGGQLFGFDGQGGPWSLWNEGTAQYIATGGSGANDLLWELLAQQPEDGGMPGSPDDFNGDGVWTTRWRGVAPTAWLYFAQTNEPFRLTSTLPSVAAQDGWVLETAENSNAGGAINSATTTLRLGDDAARKQYRSILSFATKGLPDKAVITRVILKVSKESITGSGDPANLFQGFMLDVRKGFFGPSAGLQAVDFQASTDQSFGPFKPALVGDWYTFNLTPAKNSINKLNTGGGVTQVRLRFKLDDNNNALANTLSLFSGDAPAGSRPQLIVEYYVP